MTCYNWAHDTVLQDYVLMCLAYPFTRYKIYGFGKIAYRTLKRNFDC